MHAFYSAHYCKIVFEVAPDVVFYREISKYTIIISENILRVPTCLKSNHLVFSGVCEVALYFASHSTELSVVHQIGPND